MIVKSICNTCFQTYQLLVTHNDAVLVKLVSEQNGQYAKCPRLCGGLINLTGSVPGEVDWSKAMHVTGRELYQAIHGMGLDDEIPKNPETVKALLRANQVMAVNVEEIDGKIYLHEIHLSNALTIHLAAGMRGAQVLKVTATRVEPPPAKEEPDGPGRDR